MRHKFYAYFCELCNYSNLTIRVLFSTCRCEAGALCDFWNALYVMQLNSRSDDAFCKAGIHLLEPGGTTQVTVREFVFSYLFISFSQKNGRS
jgi:hypothetical protein